MPCVTKYKTIVAAISAIVYVIVCQAFTPPYFKTAL